MPKKKAIVIGAGIGGIGVAIRLAVKGYAVEVFEANSYAGGKLTWFEKDGYFFDAGPSLFTMPQYVDELFALAGKDPRAHFNFSRLDIICNYFFADGTNLIQHADQQKTADEFEKKTNEPAVSINTFLDNSRKIYNATHGIFLERSLHRLSTYFNRDAFASFSDLFKIDPMRTMHEANETAFSDARVVQFFDRYATYNGSNPYQAPATLNVIPHLENGLGAWFPEGGMRSITDSLVSLAESIGVKMNYNSPVEEITTKGQKVTGVIVNSITRNADVIVSNSDVWFTYNKLLKKRPELAPKKILQQERSSSALIFYWGINKQFVQLDLHNIFFSADYNTEFQHIWENKTISDDPTVYVNISSKCKPDDAPLGHENWFVMINVPANIGQDWDALITKARADIIKKLSAVLKRDIGALITCESVLDPRSIEGRTSSYQGSIYGSSSNSKFAAFLRHANRSSKLKNLFFCGGSVHPGGGIPLALLSAKIVSDWVPDPA
ncbi:1-hydroxycarotenoid 3,4-desaturase CrtD [Mucilaginibacter ginkgonis]|uniref:Phytoene desaturase n=1 Tax=Mucilaginibacter ginkgonis TaxID=2682091 RepID=A0A6I4I2S1_9SPHI|nr:1-hydroxycarotenoid 3,4-desaturase CrtD [Mucilaginibacter ginkgonis]QQL49243.1 phytoene desaturase [Mucilaginibacter ginkgonis]